MARRSARPPEPNRWVFHFIFVSLLSWSVLYILYYISLFLTDQPPLFGEIVFTTFIMTGGPLSIFLFVMIVRTFNKSELSNIKLLIPVTFYFVSYFLVFISVPFLDYVEPYLNDMFLVIFLLLYLNIPPALGLISYLVLKRRVTA